MNNPFNDYILDRLLEFRRIDPIKKCWIWTRSRTSQGYGHIRFKEKDCYTHILAAYLCLNFDLNSELLVCHKCDVRACFNPLHLFIGDQFDNMRDAAKKGRLNYKGRFELATHCQYGHEYSEENIYITPSSGKRRCVICRDEYRRNYRIKYRR